ncbi:MAG: septation protein SpoVG family protein [Planctomycetota bacterium]
MDITDVRVKLVGDREDKLRAFCTVTFDDCFVVRDLKVICGSRGLFVAMPSRKLTDLCPQCSGKNHLRARFCNDCGGRLAPDRAERDETGRAKLHADVAHPIHQSYRDQLQGVVLAAFEEEVARSERPDYRPSYHDDEDESPPDADDEAEQDDQANPGDKPEQDDQADPGDKPEPSEQDEPASPSEPPTDTDDDSSHRFGEGILP